MVANLTPNLPAFPVIVAKTMHGGLDNKLANYKTRKLFLQKRANRSFIMSETADATIILPIDNTADN